MFEWTGDTKVNRHMPYPLRKDISETIDYLSSIPDKANEFAFCLKSTGKVIGSGEISFDPDRNARELGYNLNRAYWGNGYATEFVTAFLPVIMKQLDITEMIGVCLADNKVSQKVMERCNFQKLFEGTGNYQGREREICRYVYDLKFN